METADTYRHDNWTTEKEAHAHNKGLPKAGVTSFYDSFVLNQTLVFQMNGSAETPRLRQAPNRWLQWLGTLLTLNISARNEQTKTITLNQ